MVRTGAVVVAAGLSSRMGEFKPLLQVGAISTARRVVETLKQGGAELVVVVTGNRAEELERHLAHTGAVFVRNPDYAHTDMLCSARLGLAYCMDQCEQALFTPVDVPLFTAQTVRRLCASGAPMAIPCCEGTDGHPILLRTDILPPILAYTGTDGLRGALAASGVAPLRLSVEDAGVLFDMDTPEDYAAMLRLHNQQMLRPVAKLQLAREEIFFGPGAARFLQLIVETGSVRGACARMGLSYSKAWKILDNIEKNYGAPAVTRKRGGKAGGASEMTPEGRELLQRYEAFSAECQTAREALFAKYFGDKL